MGAGHHHGRVGPPDEEALKRLKGYEARERATLVTWDAYAAGRIARGERFAFDALRAMTRIQRNGSPEATDGFDLLGGRERFGGYSYVASAYVSAPQDLTPLAEELDNFLSRLPGTLASASAPTSGLCAVRVMSTGAGALYGPSTVSGASPDVSWGCPGPRERCGEEVLRDGRRKALTTESYKMPDVEVRVGSRGERHVVPAVAWAASFVVCFVGDALLGRWVLLPLYVAGFYGGMVAIDLVTYPMLDRWRGWLRRRGLWAWYVVEVGGIWLGTTAALVLLSPFWLGWIWTGTVPLQVLGAVLLVASVAVGTWAVGKMGWARLLFAGALFPPGAGAEENNVPQRLVVEGPYRYVRNPLYVTDFCLIVGAALLTRNWALVLLAALYAAQLALQLPLEERELRERFGDPYRRYCGLVPRFIPRTTPVRRRDLS